MLYHVSFISIEVRRWLICAELFAIYKEVQSMFETGRLNVPEDVTLLFQDDNFGTIRRLPTKEEAKRKGGAGVSCSL